MGSEAFSAANSRVAMTAQGAPAAVVAGPSGYSVQATKLGRHALARSPWSAPVPAGPNSPKKQTPVHRGSGDRLGPRAQDGPCAPGPVPPRQGAGSTW